MAKKPKRGNQYAQKKPNKGTRAPGVDSRVLSPETKAALERIFIADKKAG